MKRHKTLKLRHTKEASEFIPMVAWLGLRNVIMHSLSQVSSFCKTHRWSVRNLSEIMSYIWLDLTAGVVLVITGMILFYLRKGTEKAIKMGEHQLDVPRSTGG